MKIFDAAWSWIKETAAHLLGDAEEASKATADQGIAELDALTKKYVPLAVEQVKVAAENADLSSAEKRDAAVAGIKTVLAQDGHDLAAEGTNSFVNLLVEFGVNLVKAMTGTSLKAPTPPAAS